ncbi:MAG: glycosyltransferase [Psychroflexus sp.]|nr:glycosyltransferase [Psychroflexus sp.]
MSKIKILHVLHSVGGVDVSLRLIVNNLDPNSFESIIVKGQVDTDEPFYDANNSPIKTYNSSIIRAIHPLKDLKAIKNLQKIVKSEEPDLIHAHSAKGGILGKSVGHFEKTPVLHTPQAYSFLSADSKIKKSVFLTIEKGFAKLNNKILASSTSERNRAVNEVGYPTERALLFNNSIKPIKKINDLNIPKTWPDQYICSVGRPSYQKNIEMMVKVLAKVKNEKPDIHLVLMGVGFHSPNLEAVKTLIQELNLSENISLLEWTEREDIFHIIKKSQLYISTARYEGLPYSIIEALALQKACVVTDADGNRDLIQDNHNGFVIFDENTTGFSEKINLLLNDVHLKEKFENNAGALFDKKFNINNTIQSLEKIYLNNLKK